MQKLLCQVATTELLPRGDKENGHTKKMTKARLDWCLIVMVLSLSNLADPYFVPWWSLQQLLRRKVFSRFKRI